MAVSRFNSFSWSESRRRRIWPMVCSPSSVQFPSSKGCAFSQFVCGGFETVEALFHGNKFGMTSRYVKMERRCNDDRSSVFQSMMESKSKGSRVNNFYAAVADRTTMCRYDLIRHVIDYDCVTRDDWRECSDAVMRCDLLAALDDFTCQSNGMRPGELGMRDGMEGGPFLRPRHLPHSWSETLLLLLVSQRLRKGLMQDSIGMTSIITMVSVVGVREEGEGREGNGGGDGDELVVGDLLVVGLRVQVAELPHHRVHVLQVQFTVKPGLGSGGGGWTLRWSSCSASSIMLIQSSPWSSLRFSRSRITCTTHSDSVTTTLFMPKRVDTTGAGRERKGREERSHLEEPVGHAGGELLQMLLRALRQLSNNTALSQLQTVSSVPKRSVVGVCYFPSHRCVLCFNLTHSRPYVSLVLIMG